MATYNLQDITEDIMNTVRNSDVISIANRGVTTGSFSGSAGLGSTFDLGQTGIKNIRSYTRATVAQRLFKDFTVNWATGIVTSIVAFAGGEALVVSFDYGTGDKIYPDMPRADLSLSSYPRVGLQITNSNTQDFGLGGASHISDILITVYVWVPANKDSSVAGGIGGTESLKDLLTTIRTSMRTNAKLFGTFPFVTPKTTSPVMASDDKKLLQLSQDYNVRFVVE